MRNKTINKGLKGISKILGGLILGGLAVATSPIMEVIIAVLVVALLIANIVGISAGIVDYFITVKTACETLVDNLGGIQASRQAAVNEYYDKLNSSVSNGCCDKGEEARCRNSQGEFLRCKDADGNCPTGSSVSPPVGTRLIGLNEKIYEDACEEFCGYRSSCIPQPNCLTMSFSPLLPGEPNFKYLINTWPLPGEWEITATDTRPCNFFSPVKVPTAISSPDGTPNSHGACGWDYTYADDVICPNWDSVERVVLNRFTNYVNSILDTIGGAVIDIGGGVLATVGAAAEVPTP